MRMIFFIMCTFFSDNLCLWNYNVTAGSGKSHQTSPQLFKFKTILFVCLKTAL